MASLQRELKQTRGFASAEQEAFLNLQRTAGELAGPFHQLLKSQGLSMPLYNVLRILRGQAGRGLPSSRIGERMVSRDPDVTRLVDKLVQRGLADRQRSQADRRVVEISITTAGSDLLAELDAPVADLHDRTLGHMSARQLNDLNRLLVRARAACRAGDTDNQKEE